MVGTPGKAGDALVDHRLQHLGRERERPLEHQPGAHARRHDQLIEPVVERQRQHAEDDVVFLHPQVGADRRRRRQHVAVREHHALRVAGRARGVDDRGEIDVEAAARRRRVALGRQIRILRPDDRAFQVRRAGRRRLPDGAQVLVGDEERRPAVLEVVLELVGLGQRVDDRHHRAGLEHGPERDHGVHRVVAVDDDPVAALDAALDQDVRQVVGAPIDGAERQAILGPDEPDLVAQHARGVLDVVVQLGDGSVDVGHGWMRVGGPCGAPPRLRPRSRRPSRSAPAAGAGSGWCGASIRCP